MAASINRALALPGTGIHSLIERERNLLTGIRKRIMVPGMKLTFLYQPVKDINAAVAFYRDVLGFDEAWREGDGTVAFKLPGSDVEVMLDVPTSDGPQSQAGGFYIVDSVDKFVAEHPTIDYVGEVLDVPGGRAVTFLDPAGNAVHLADQAD
jgi:catechol 2,3-dioxygenase-like lactoylglutathione lyase family enzyme